MASKNEPGARTCQSPSRIEDAASARRAGRIHDEVEEEGAACCMAATLTPDRSSRQDQFAGRRPDRSAKPLRSRLVAAEETPQALEPSPCTVCRGTGTLISNLGGSPSQVPCSWCEGTGTFLPDHDAQAERRAAAAGDDDAPAQS